MCTEHERLAGGMRRATRSPEGSAILSSQNLRNVLNRKDRARILRLLAEAEAAAPPGTRIQVVLEATGGYEAALVAALHAAERPVSVIQPSRTRHFARVRAEHAKTDPIDADVLTAFGEALQPAPTHSTAQSHLAVLVGRRAQLVTLRAAGKVKMVALTAVMRKLVVLFNRPLKNPQFKLQAAA